MNASATKRIGRNGTVAVALAVLGALLLIAAPAQAQTALGNGHPRVVHGLAGSVRYFFIDVPANATRLTIRLSGGVGNANIYAKRNPIAVGPWTHNSTHPHNNEQINQHNPQRGRWHIAVHGLAGYHGATLIADYAVRNRPGTLQTITAGMGPVLGAAMTHMQNRSAQRNADRDDDDDDEDDDDDDDAKDNDGKRGGKNRIVRLRSGAPVEGISGKGFTRTYYRIVVPQATGLLTIETNGGRGDCLLLVRRNALPTARTHDYQSAKDGTSQIVSVKKPAVGVYYIVVVGAPRYRGVSLTAERQNVQTAPVITTLENGVWKRGLSAEPRSCTYFALPVARACSGLTFRTRGGKGECLVLVRRNGLPTGRLNHFKAAGEGTEHTINVDRDMPAGMYYVMLYSRRGFRGLSIRAAAKPKADAESEAIRILSPSSAEVLTAGATYQVKWRSSDCVRTASIQVSWDRGRSWTNLASLPAKTPMFFWYVPADQACESADVLLRISDADNPANTAIARLTLRRS